MAGISFTFLDVFEDLHCTINALITETGGHEARSDLGRGVAGPKTRASADAANGESLQNRLWNHCVVLS